MLGLVVVLTLFLFIACFLLVNYESIQRCVGYCMEQQDTTPVMAAVLHPVSSLEESLGPGPLDLHLPYSSCEILLPPSSEEDSQRDWNTAPLCPEALAVESQCASLGVPEDGVAMIIFGGVSSRQGCAWGYLSEPAEWLANLLTSNEEAGQTNRLQSWCLVLGFKKVGEKLIMLLGIGELNFMIFNMCLDFKKSFILYYLARTIHIFTTDVLWSEWV